MNFRSTKQRNRGAAMLETAIVLPIFLLLILGILEFGRAAMISQMTTNACREGARRAVVPGATDSDVTSMCNNYLDSANISQTGRILEIQDSSGTVTPLTNIGSHQDVKVVIDVPFDENSWGMISWLVGKRLRNEVTMRRE